MRNAVVVGIEPALSRPDHRRRDEHSTNNPDHRIPTSQKESDMKLSRVFVFSLIGLAWLTQPALAVEEGQLVKKDGKWEYYSGEDPGLKYLYMKGLITQEE